jgi:chromosomal replication initiation ATPase DnaA
MFLFNGREAMRRFNEITEIVAEIRGVDLDDIYSPLRHREISWPRQECMYVIQKTVGSSLPLIGRHFARDHTTVLHALRSVEKRIAESDEYANEIGDMLDRAAFVKRAEFHSNIPLVFKSRRETQKRNIAS